MTFNTLMIDADFQNLASGIFGPLQLPGRTVSFESRPALMGILNINDDSFSGDGRVDTDWALERAVAMVREGADFLDIGAESARTNRPPISEDEEIARVLPFLERWPEFVRRAQPRDEHQIFPPVLSLNTWRTSVVRVLLPHGIELLNDMGGLPDPANACACAESGAALLIMHTVGLPKQKHTHVTHPDLLPEMLRFFREKIALAREAGVSRRSIVLDPGFGFAKQTADDLQVLANPRALFELGFPVLLPVSRKGFIGRTIGVQEPALRDAGTIAALTWAMQRGAGILRVHNVDAAWRTRRTLDALGVLNRELTGNP